MLYFLYLLFIAETLKELNAEEASDKHLRGTFGAKWNRTKSEDLTKSFKDQGDKYQVFCLVNFSSTFPLIWSFSGNYSFACKDR